MATPQATYVLGAYADLRRHSAACVSPAQGEGGRSRCDGPLNVNAASVAGLSPCFPLRERGLSRG